ncbi:MAG: SPOR domain-containing protein [Mesorhizobium sp.]
MADKTSGVNAGREDLMDSDVPAADPFAELTRIMGFDPRKAEGAKKVEAQAASAEEFKIDLEEELMREFGEEEFADEPVAVAAPEPEFSEPLPPLEAHAEDEPVAHAEAPQFDEADVAVAAAQPFEEEPVDDILAAELEAQTEDDIPVIKLSPVNEQPQEAPREEPVAFVADEADEAELEAEFNALLGNSEHHEILDTRAENLASVSQQPTQEEFVAAEASVSMPAAEDDLSVEFGFPEPAEALDKLPEVEAAEAFVEETEEELSPVEATEEAEEVVAAVQEEVEPVAEVKAEEPPAVEEDDPFAMLAAMAQKYRVAEPNDSWRTAAPVFSRATPQINRVEQPIARAEAQPVRVEPRIEQRIEPQAPVVEMPAPRVEAPQVAAYIRPEPVVAAPIPEIETIDVPDRAVAVADDLDIPELEIAEEPLAVAPVDDLDTEFNNLLQQMSTPAPATAPARATPSFAGVSSRPAQPAPDMHNAYSAQTYAQPAAPQQAYAPQSQPASSYGYAPQPAAPASYDRPAAHTHQDDDDIRIDLTEDDLAEAFDDFDTAAMDDFDLDGDFEDDVAPKPYLQSGYQKQPKKRGLLIAAIIGGVAILGVAGAVAMSMMGDAQGSSPELVKADQAPFRVRPETPTASTQPSQESKVYETVARTGDANANPQDKLITSNEEPVDLPDQLPDNADDDVAMSDDGAVKSDDRIQPTTAEDAQPADGESIAVAPRKVRTMVVKPDGSLAPREEIEPQATNTIAPQNKTAAAAPAAANDDVASAIGSNDDAPALPADDDQAAAQPADVAPDQTASIEPQPAVEGGWTMQIASESSEAAAKATYQKMLGRYGNVLEGKGVNIVKADIAGKGTFWRIRIPAETRDAAAGMCNSFKSAGGKCFVTKT